MRHEASHEPRFQLRNVCAFQRGIVQAPVLPGHAASAPELNGMKWPARWNTESPTAPGARSTSNFFMYVALTVAMKRPNENSGRRYERLKSTPETSVRPRFAVGCVIELIWPWFGPLWKREMNGQYIATPP